jgi:eukaryotic-like serine/threonine-protein kinase
MRARDTGEIVLADRYELRAEIGTGGMGVVRRAHDRLLQRDVAVKEVHLPAEVARGDEAIVQRRVLREARAAARLSHPSAVTVYDVVQEEGRAYIVMELVEAPTLAAVVERDGPLSPGRVAALGLEVLGAIEKAHSEGIVHRDVKPGNVMFGPGGAKLADFGIASLKGDPKLTATGVLLGSPSFMAPEQAQGDDSGPAADLWALGATLYYAVEGVPPFARGQPIATLAAVVYDEPRRPERAGPLAGILMRLLSKSPADRPSVAEVREALEATARAASAGDATQAVETPVSAPGRANAESVWASTGEPAWRSEPAPGPRRRDRAQWVVMAGAFLLALFVALLLFRPAPPAPETEESGRSGRSQEDRGAAPSGGNGSRGSGGAGDGSGGEAPTVPQEDSTAVESSGIVPPDWIVYEDPSSGFRVAHPPDWEVTEQSRDADSIDIDDPTTGGTYLRIDWTDSPGPSPVKAWQQQAEGFAARHDNYQEIQIAPATFKGFEAAIWEFTYSDGGVELHAADIGFVTDDYGFALFWQTQADAWEESEDLFRAFQAGFEPPP